MEEEVQEYCKWRGCVKVGRGAWSGVCLLVSGGVSKMLLQSSTSGMVLMLGI